MARSEDMELPLEDYEEDYYEGLPEEEEGITYYIRCCHKDDSYLEGMDCNGDEYLVHGTHPMDTDMCQEHPHNMPLNWTREEWLDSAGLHPHGHCAEGSQDYPDGLLPILEGEPSALEAHKQEEYGHYCPSKESYQDCYPTGANGNSGTSHYHLRHGNGDVEDQEEDIDPIMAKIKRNLSMTSITSAKEASMSLSWDLGICRGLPAQEGQMQPQQARSETQVTEPPS
ncbi:Amyloid-beta A4 precursor protein-binding A member 2 [Saguinus oedipus]|uniref:Amyloid-beta A4 protein-binding A member 2 n=1 Tax=Saguinus oedipus TaxID=9490 RepID=A0ABQ9V2Z0_SAGOE|nr:Amyloid-beta A4 precursor protein-binding A member 2 [Saguinus oedipus]